MSGVHHLLRALLRAYAGRCVLLAAGLAAACLATGCGGSDSGRADASERRAVVVDTDLGADDVLALAILLRDPSVDVRAVTVAGTGLVHCAAGVGRLVRLLAAFGMQKPVACGREHAGPDGHPLPAAWRAASDKLYGLRLPPASAETATEDVVSLLARTLRSGAGKTTIVTLGPWTNLEDLLRRHAELHERVASVHAMGGALDVTGNVGRGTAEANVYADPSAVASVLRSAIPLTLVPLDATRRVPLTPRFRELLGQTPAAGASIARDLIERNPSLLAGQYLWDELAAAALLDPSLVKLERVRIAVETRGRDAGRLDRSDVGREVLVALDADGPRAMRAIVRGLARGPAPRGIAEPPRSIVFRYDGSSCALASGSLSRPGPYQVTFEDEIGGAVLYLVSASTPHRWREARDFWRTRQGRQVETTDLPPWMGALADVVPGLPVTVDFPDGVSGPICAASARYVVGEPQRTRP